MADLLSELTLCIGVAWCLGIVAQWVGQPPLLAYLLGGFVIGPAGFGWLVHTDSVESVSELGLIFLLFMVGLEIDLKKVISAGRSISVTAAAQIGGGLLLGVAVFSLAGFSLGAGQRWDALYLAVAAATSSTVIIVKVLYDRRELDTLPGRITLGILVVQDLFAILFLALQPSLDHLRADRIAFSVLRVAVLVTMAMTLSRYVLPSVFHRVARLPELVLVGSIAWCFGVGELAARLELSREMGALIAGVALSTFPYALDVTAKVTSLRDFFVTLFFIGLGLRMQVPRRETLMLAFAFSAFTVASRLVTTFIPLYRMRLGLRASLLPALYLCQISEFSLVVLALGASKHHVSEGSQGAVALAFVLLALLSTWVMTESDPIVRRVIPSLLSFGLRDLGDRQGKIGDSGTDDHGSGAPAPQILLLGFYRTASSLLAELMVHAPDLLSQVGVVDFNPVVHARLRQRGVRVTYGDVSQRETLVHAGLQKAKIIVCTIPDSLLKGISNERLVRQLRELNPNAIIFAPAETLSAVPQLEAVGADFVSVGRIDEAQTLFNAIRASQSGLLEEFRQRMSDRQLARQEIVD